MDRADPPSSSPFELPPVPRGGMSLRRFVVLMVLVGMVPLLGFELVYFRLEQRAMVQQELDDMRNLAQLVAGAQEQLIDGVDHLLKAVAAAPVGQDSDPAQCNRYLERLQASDPGFANVGVIGADGHLGCRATTLQERVYLGDRPYFQRAMGQGRFAVGEYALARTSGKKTLGFGHPIRAADGTVRAVAYAAIDLRRLDEKLRAAAGATNAQIRVTDTKGVVLASSHEDFAAVGEPLADPVLLQGVRAGSTGPLEGAAKEEVAMLRMVHAIQLAGQPVLYVTVSQPAAAVLKALARNLYLHLGVILAIAVVSVSVIWGLCSLWLLRPLEQVIGDMHHVERDGVADPQQRRGTPLRELAHLRAALTRMVLSLAARRSERDQALHALGEREMRYRELFESNPHVMWVYDTQTLRFLAVNHAAVAQYGYSEPEFLQRTLLDIRDMDERAALLDVVRRPREGQEGLAGGARRMRHRTRSGAERVVEVASQPLQFAGRNARLAMVTDISERVEAEARVQQVHDQLEALVAERTRALELSNKELEAFAYSVSHDLRAPLRAINMFAQMLTETAAQPSAENVGMAAGRIHESAMKMNQLIGDLLELSRVSRAELVRVPVDMSELCSDTLRDLQQQQPERKVSVQITPGMACHGDLALLRQLMVNLLGNAWKFTGRCTDARIEVGPWSPDIAGQTGFYVRDNGAGFDMRYAERLFQPFQRLHGASDFPGTGIGLATVQRILARHGGSVRAESAPGQGTTFYFSVASSA